MATRAPSPANSRAVASPMPFVAPVIRTRLSFSPRSMPASSACLVATARTQQSLGELALQRRDRVDQPEAGAHAGKRHPADHRLVQDVVAALLLQRLLHRLEAVLHHLGLVVVDGVDDAPLPVAC